MTNEQEILIELRAMRADLAGLSAELRAIKAIDDTVDGPNRLLIQRMNEEVTRLKERQPKATAAAATGGSLGLTAMIIEGIRLWLGMSGGNG